MNNPIVIALEVLTLQRFLDAALLTHAPERLFVRVRAYYRLSPPIAHAVASQPLLTTRVRAPAGLGRSRCELCGGSARCRRRTRRHFPRG